MRAYQITTLVESFKDAKVKFSNEEDEHTVDVYIDTFKELAKRNIIKGSDKDIGKWIKSGWEEFKAFVDDAKEKNSNRDVKKKRINKSNEYIVLVDNDEYTAVLPLTERSSCYYGKKTNWCVSVVSEDNMFDAYVAAGKFPVHIMKDGEIYSLVYSFITQDITEYRDSENKEYSAYMFKEHVADPQPIINKILAHESKLMKLSESKRLKDSKTAAYYALHKKVRFEEGEKLIAENFKYSLHYMIKCLHYMMVPDIDKTLLSRASELEDLNDNKADAYEVFEKYLKENHSDGLPSYADEDYIMKTFPKFYLNLMIEEDEVLSEDAFKNMIEYHSVYYDVMDKKENDGFSLSFLDYNGLDKVLPLLDYIKYLHANEHMIDGYVNVFYETLKPKKAAVIGYIKSDGYTIGFSDKLLEALPEDSRLSLQNVFDIVRDAPNGAYIFTTIKPEQVSAEALYKMGRVNHRIYKIIGEIPQKVKDYAEENNLDLPS